MDATFHHARGKIKTCVMRLEAFITRTDKIIPLAIIFALVRTDLATIDAWIIALPIPTSNGARTFLATTLTQALGQISTGSAG